MHLAADQTTHAIGCRPDTAGAERDQPTSAKCLVLECNSNISTKNWSGLQDFSELGLDCDLNVDHRQL